MGDGPTSTTDAPMPPPPRPPIDAPQWAIPVPELATFRAMAPWSTAALVLVGLATVGRLVSAIAGLRYANALVELKTGSMTLRAASAIEEQFVMVELFAMLAWIGAIVASVGWLYAAAKNAQLMRPGESEHTPKWAIWGWFVPIMNLARPYGMVCQVWDQCRGGAQTWAKVPTLIKAWWGLFVAANVVGRIASSQMANATTMLSTASAVRWAVASSALLVVSGMLFLLVIHHVTKRHEAAVVEFTADPASFATYPRRRRTHSHDPFAPTHNGTVLARNRTW